MVINWWWIALSIVALIGFICCYIFPVRQIKKQFKQAIFWTWYMHKDKDKLTDEDIDNLNYREWNNIFDQISWCWFFGSMSIILFAVFLFWGLGVLN